MKYSVKLYSEFSRELGELSIYITRRFDAPQRAQKQAARIVKAAESLAVSPKRHRVRKTDSHGRELRFFPVDNYTLVYSVDDNAKTVSILRVVYGRWDIASML